MPDISPIQAFTLGADAAYLASRPLPVAPDGRYDWEAGSDAGTGQEGHSSVTNLINEVCMTSGTSSLTTLKLTIRSGRLKEFRPKGS